MKLWVLRHGEAESHAPSDAQRNLTERGREEVLHSAAHLIGQPISAIIASPYVRAQQTAQLVREALGFVPEIRTVSWLTPDGNPLQVLEKLDTDDNVLLLKTNMGAGHGGKSGRFESLREAAEEHAFVLWQLGLGQMGISG